MSKAISFSDLQLHSTLSGYSEIDMLHIDMDDKVNAVLSELGFDVDYGTSYYPAKHRNLQDKVLIGFIATGDVSINRKHLTSVFADLTDVLVASSYNDPSLTRELAALSGLSRNYGNNQDSDDYGDDQESLPPDQLEPDWEEVEKYLRQLEDIRDELRGPMYMPCGSLKTPEDYKLWYEEQTTKGN